MFRIEKLVYRVDSFQLGPLSLELKKGEFYTIMGPSGAGKSVLLELISGLRREKQGTVIIAGADSSNLPPERRRVGMVFQKNLLFPHLTVFDNIAFGLRVKKLPESLVRQKIKKIAELTGISHLLYRSVHGLSGGESQRIALARALVTDPVLLLLDEPFNALDRTAREELRGELRRIQKQLDVTTIFVTHDFEEAAVLSDRIGVLINGQIVQEGSPGDILQKPATWEVARLVGYSNIISGYVKRSGETGVFCSGDINIPVNTDIPEGPAIVFIRPEGIYRITGKGTEAVVEEVAECPGYTRIVYRLAHTALVSKESWMGNKTVNTGQRVEISIDPRFVHVVPQKDGNTLGVFEYIGDNVKTDIKVAPYSTIS